MTVVVDIRIDGGDWQDAVPGVETLCRETASAAVATAGMASAEVSLLLTDDAAVAALNGAYRGKDEPTNVLSFPAIAPGEADDAGADGIGATLLGDVAVAYETTVAEAAAEGKTLADHLRHLLVHGVLHLLGHDHQDDPAAEVMERLEAEILRTFDVADPYRDEKHIVA